MSRALRTLRERGEEKQLPTHLLLGGHSVIVEGPASISLLQGDGTALGAPLYENTWTVIPEERRLPIETENGATLDLRLGLGGKCEDVHHSTIPTGWKEASQIIRQSPGTVAVLGDVDSGKSTLSAFLANECFRQGMNVRIIDADIGQADIGPPATISLSSLKEHIFSLQELRPEASLFIGDTSPSLIIEKLARGIVRLKESSSRGDVLLVNTDGWVKGEQAFHYKLQLLDAIQPNFLFGIGSNHEVDLLLENQKATALRLSRSAYAKTRTREERKRAREFGYRRFLREAVRLELKLADVKLRRFNSHQQLKIRDDENLRGVLAGLLNEEDSLLSVGRIESLRNGRLTVWTVRNGRPVTVELGSVLLSPSYEELGYES